ncbi:LLM class flavin-dependent oxidoreductase [Tengunoibacter tsumagoiensis]|uniref:Luciferase-like protein n=1 Tax=Tengunoibacter tsumagoiensis TaxID=2014871 RepID=A0A402A707_9CHLR|nr:LLM class flavin-dependent oxidoreductase [Tengunoibacter tsumagoiensis]GCE14816.1 luciferase-like protein [Tengunoibacter tsumagoiensis]
MKFALNIPNFDIYSDVHLLTELVHEAEEAGWDGFFLWDHIGGDWQMAIADPWIALAAMAMVTKRITLGPLVTPLPRRRPWKVAREAVTLDHLSHGRLVLGVGIGSDQGREFSCFGEEADDRLHGDMLDEGLEVLTRLWSGERFSYEGKHYQLSNACFLPTPIQQPRIPIWLAGTWPNKKPFRRAARWDGICPIGRDHELTPQDFRDMLAYIELHRSTNTPFDVLTVGQTTGTDRTKDRATVQPFAEAGVTWWQEGFDRSYSLEQVRQRIHLGPPEL